MTTILQAVNFKNMTSMTLLLELATKKIIETGMKLYHSIPGDRDIIYLNIVSFQEAALLMYRSG
jgi:hypothetical protein